MYGDRRSLVFFFFNDTATTEIYTLSLHDALPICDEVGPDVQANQSQGERVEQVPKAVTHLLRDHDHSRGKVARGGRSLNRASTWRAAAGTARAPGPSCATRRPRRGR